MTITSIPYYGHTDVVFELDTTKTYIPFVEMQNSNTSITISKCSPRCVTCAYF